MKTYIKLMSKLQSTRLWQKLEQKGLIPLLAFAIGSGGMTAADYELNAMNAESRIATVAMEERLANEAIVLDPIEDAYFLAQRVNYNAANNVVMDFDETIAATCEDVSYLVETGESRISNVRTLEEWLADLIDGTFKVSELPVLSEFGSWLVDMFNVSHPGEEATLEIMDEYVVSSEGDMYVDIPVMSENGLETSTYVRVHFRPYSSEFDENREVVTHGIEPTGYTRDKVLFALENNTNNQSRRAGWDYRCEIWDAYLENPGVMMRTDGTESNPTLVLTQAEGNPFVEVLVDNSNRDSPPVYTERESSSLTLTHPEDYTVWYNELSADLSMYQYQDYDSGRLIPVTQSLQNMGETLMQLMNEHAAEYIGKDAQVSYGGSITDHGSVDVNSIYDHGGSYSGVDDLLDAGNITFAIRENPSEPVKGDDAVYEPNGEGQKSVNEFLDETPTPSRISGLVDGNMADLGYEVSQKFPFSVPFDVSNAINKFVASPEAPRFTWVFALPTGDVEYDVDLAPFSPVANVMRATFNVLLCFCVIGLLTKIAQVWGFFDRNGG